MTTSPFQFRRRWNTAANRELFRKAFPHDEWVGDHHAFWVVRSKDTEEVAGFCSAVLLANEPTVFFSIAYVFLPFRGQGLQQAMARHRTAWAKRSGATTIVTYTMVNNWPSAASLLKSGFRQYEPQYRWSGRVWYFQRSI